MKRLFVAGIVLALAGCGGGGDSPAPVPQQSISSPTPAGCTLPVFSSEYPKEYLGNFAIPTPTQKFDSSVMRMVSLKDLHPTLTGTMKSNCSQTEYSRAVYIRTLDRLQSMGVDVVGIYQYAPFVDFNASVWTVDKKDWQIPESELIWLLQEANRRKMKVNLTWQLWPKDSKNNWIDTSNTYMYSMSEKEMVKILEGWRNVAVDLAKLAGQYNVNSLELDWTAFWFPPPLVHREVATQKFISIAEDVRKYFNGELNFGQGVPYEAFDNRVLDKVNAIRLMMIPRITDAENKNLSVQLLKAKFSEIIKIHYDNLSRITGKGPGQIAIIWDVQIQSRDKFWTEGWVEDAFCIDNCIQKTYKTDFSVQAIGVEAFFQAVNEQKYFKNHAVNFHSAYWHTDNVTPFDRGWDDAAKINNFDFPNISQSIRSKPAEEIAKAWFAR